MSIAAMNWAWAQALPPSSKLILMSLADAADETGLCWPRIRVIAKKCCVSERTVQRVIKEFERDGVLIVQRHYRDNGAQTSNRYQMQIGSTPDKMSLGVGARSISTDKMSPPPRHTCRRVGDTAVSPLELPTKPSIKITTTCNLQADSSVCAELVMPKRLPEGDRSGIVAILREVPLIDAQALLDELAAALELPGTIKTTPGRWFYGLVKKYAQGKFNPVGAHLVAARRAQPKAPVKAERAVAASSEVARAHLAKIAAALHIADLGVNEGARELPQCQPCR